jgi:signal transduction histidine kinase
MFLLARLLYIKYEINNVTNQLKEINKSKTDSKVVVGLLDKDFEELATAINENIEIRKQCEASKIRTENALKGAIADMSHDLRTPLTSVLGYLQFMKMDNNTEEERKEFLEVAFQRAKVLESLLNDFYTLSLIDSAEFQITFEKINLSKIIRELLVERYNEFKSRNLEMNTQIPDKNIHIIGDIRSVNRVVENLLSNVIKYAKDKVEISLVAEEKAILLIISNNVANLHHDEIGRLFDRFYMADKTRCGEGTGLGLAISKALMEKMNGEINIAMLEDVLTICCRFRVI